MKRTVTVIALILFIVLGVLFTVCYCDAFINTAATAYLFFSVFAALEAIMTLISLVCYLKAKKGAWVNVLNILSVALWIPILLIAVVWLLSWIGIDLLPPPQQ